MANERFKVGWYRTFTQFRTPQVQRQQQHSSPLDVSEGHMRADLTDGQAERHTD